MATNNPMPTQLDLIRFQALPKKAKKKKKRAVAVSVVPQKKIEYRPPCFAKNLDNYIFGKSNESIELTLKEMVKRPGRTHPFIFLHGVTGMGKTHLVHGIYNQLRNKHSKLRILFTEGKELLARFEGLAGRKEWSEFIFELTEDLDCIIIDDLQDILASDDLQKDLCYIIDRYYLYGKQIIFTSEVLPKKMQGVYSRLSTRMKWALMLNIQPPASDTRLKILEQKMEEFDFFLDKDVGKLVANSFHEQVNELESALLKLKSHSLKGKEEIGCNEAMKILYPMAVTLPMEQEVNHQKIFEIVGEFMGVAPMEISGRSRNSMHVLARHIVMYYLYTKFNHALSYIAKLFSMDHSSIIYGVRKVEKMLLMDRNLQKILFHIDQKCSRENI